MIQRSGERLAAGGRKLAVWQPRFRWWYGYDQIATFLWNTAERQLGNLGIWELASGGLGGGTWCLKQLAQREAEGKIGDQVTLKISKLFRGVIGNEAQPRTTTGCFV